MEGFGGFSPFGAAFSAFNRKAQQEEMKSFEQILKEFEQFFDMTEMTGSNRSSKGIIKGRDVQTNVTISFTESAVGCKKTLSFIRNEHCKTCDGTGARPNVPPVRCMVCNGTGRIT